MATVADLGAHLTEIRLTAFKSYRHAIVPLKDLSLLVGPNASGKSNALDALSLLSLLAEERSVSELDRGDSEVAGLRGGLLNAAPYGSHTVAVGCSIRSGNSTYRLDIEFDVSGEPQISSEILVQQFDTGTKRTLLHARANAKADGIADVETYSGSNPRYFQFLTSRSAVVQALTKVPTDTKARKSVVDACHIAVAVLRAIFVLDPVPGLMRGYPRIGSAPDRNGSSTSAVVYGLREDPIAWSKLRRLVTGLIGERLEDIEFVEARLQSNFQTTVRAVDVMVALRESFEGRSHTSAASVMSDGTLRYLSIVATLLSLGRQEDERAFPGRLPVLVSRTLVVEEIENGLYPTQAAAVLELLRLEASDNTVTLIASTHSPALLDALKPEDHPGVIVCGRSREGRSSVISLIDHPSYLRVAGGGTIGTAMAGGALETKTPPRRRFSDLLDAE